MGRLFENQSKSGKDSILGLGGQRSITKSSMAWLDWDDKSQNRPFHNAEKRVSTFLLPEEADLSENNSDSFIHTVESEEVSDRSSVKDSTNHGLIPIISFFKNGSKTGKKSANKMNPARDSENKEYGIKRVLLNLALGGSIPLIFFAFLFFFSFYEPSQSAVDIPLVEDQQISILLQDYAAPEYNGIGDGGPEIPAFVNWDFESMQTHVVANGETPSGIASKYKVSLSTLLSFNDIQDVQGLKVGQELKIPPFDAILYKVRRGDMLGGIAYKHNVNINYLVDANQLEDHLIFPGQVLVIPEATLSDFDLALRKREAFVWPTRGRLSSLFGGRADPFTGKWRHHNGLDIANAEGTPIKAAMGGKVVQVGNSPMGYGKYVLIDHGNGFQTLYAHMHTISVKKGDRVSRLQRLGGMGNTGRSTGSHLHFTIYLRGVAVNPQSYLK